MSRNDHFATTRWTMIRAAGAGDADRPPAWEALCQTYWFPLYAYVRRRGCSREDAEDLTQMFFAKLLERDDFGRLESGQGKFRAFLLASLKHFLANEWDRAKRLKRGGGTIRLSLDWETADSRFEIADVGAVSPDQAFDREWALELLERVIVTLREEWQTEGKGETFDALKSFLTADRNDASYGEIAQSLGVQEGALRVTAHRLRKRYRQLLRAAIALTLADEAMVDEEMKALLGAFS